MPDDTGRRQEVPQDSQKPRLYRWRPPAERAMMQEREERAMMQEREERAMMQEREERALGKIRDELEARKLKIDEQGAKLKPLLDAIKDHRKRAFDFAKHYASTRADLSTAREFAKEKFEDYMGKFNDKAKDYKEERRSLLLKMNELNNNIRCHNKNIILYNEKMYKKKDERLPEVDEYQKSRIPGDFEHGLSLEKVIAGRLWEKFPLQGQSTN